jgi:hypothetical protein
MVEGKCSKQFPKSFRDETNSNHNGYPLYRRRDNGIFFEKKISHKIGNKIVNKVVKVI